MLSFCSNAGPSFIFGFLPLVFSDIHRIWQIWLIHIGSAVLSGMILCKSQPQAAQQVTMKNAPVMGTAVRSMAMICGWVTVFRVFICFLERWFFRRLPALISVVLIGLLELTNGCVSLQKIPDETLRFILCAGMLSFGGLCVHMQTMSILQGLSAKNYWKGKMLQTFFFSSDCLCNGICRTLVYPDGTGCSVYSDSCHAKKTGNFEKNGV